VLNLAWNAIHAAGAGADAARIELTTRASGGMAELCVADNGPGVPPAEVGRLGERFHRLAPPGESGSGLGLSIVLRIAELHGARVRFSPGLEHRGLGASVEFEKTWSVPD